MQKPFEPVVHFRSTILRRSVEEEGGRGRRRGRGWEEGEGGGPRHRATSGEIIIESEIKGLSLLCPGGGSKRPEPEWREGSSFYCLPPPSSCAPSPSCACRARESTVSPILMYLRGRGCPLAFHRGPGPASIYIALRGPGSLESCVEGTDPLLPFAPLAVVATALVYRAMVQVRSKVTGAGKVVSLFTFRSNVDDEI